MMAEETARSIKCTACKLEDLGLTDKNVNEKHLGVVRQCCSPISEETETGGSLEFTDQPA